MQKKATRESLIVKTNQNKGLDITKYKDILDKYIDEEKIRKSHINYGLVTVRLKDLKPLELTIKDIKKALHEAGIVVRQ